MTHRFFISLLFVQLFLCTHPVVAQWEYVGAPDGGAVWSMAIVDSVVMIGSGYRSLDHGKHWERMISAVNPHSVQYLDEFAIGHNHLIVAHSLDSLYRSTDLGATWKH